MPQNQPTREVNLKLIIMAFAVVMGFGVICFLAGEILTLLGTGHFSGTSLGRAPGIGIRMLGNLGQPAAAWPEATRPLFAAGTFWFVVCLIVGLIAWQMFHHAPTISRKIKGSSAPPESATWAGRGDLNELVVKEPGHYRVTLGKYGRNLIAAEERQSVCTFGPTQQGKSTAIAIPAIVEWPGSVVVTSVKNDLMVDTIAVRRKMGKVLIFDPGQTTEIERRHMWTPLARCDTFEGAQKTAKSLAETAKQATGGASENGFWYEQAQMLLAPLMYAARLGDKDMSTVISWLQRGVDARREIEGHLVEVFDGLDDLPMHTAQAVWGMANEQRDSVYLTARSVVEAYRSPKVLESARESEIRPELLLGAKPATAYLCAPITEQKQLAALYGTLINEIIDYGYQEYAKTGKPLDPPLLVVLDEAANIAPLPNLDQIASTAAGVGIQLCSIFQDVGQVKERWGQDKAQTIISNHRATVVLPGIKCEHTLRWIAEVTGEQDVRQVSFTDGRDNHSSTESLTYRKMLPSNLVREMKKNTGLLIYGNLKPVKLELRPWYAETALKNWIEDAKANDPVRFNPVTGEVSKDDPSEFKRRAASAPIKRKSMSAEEARVVDGFDQEKEEQAMVAVRKRQAEVESDRREREGRYRNVNESLRMLDEEEKELEERKLRYEESESEMRVEIDLDEDEGEE